MEEPDDKDTESGLGRIPAVIVITVGAAVLSVLGYMNGRQAAVDDILGDVKEACVSLYPPQTVLPVDVVVNRAASLVNYLETVEAGPDGVLLKVPCQTRESSPNPDLGLGPNTLFFSDTSGVAMDCDTLVGKGKVRETGLETRRGNSLLLSGWQIASGKVPDETSATLVAGVDAFKVEVSGKVGLKRFDGKVACESVPGGKEFTCDVTDQGQTNTVPLDVSNGRALLEWVKDAITKRLRIMRNFGLIPTEDAGAESSS